MLADGAATLNTVTINTAAGIALEMSTLSASGSFFCIKDDNTGPGTTLGNVDATGAVACAGGW